MTIRLTLTAILLTLSNQSIADRPPNIVLLIGDDHGYPYFGFMGDNNVVTPTMDAIAAGGVTFTQGFVTTPYCRPSLRAIITGLTPTEYQLRLDEHIESRKQADDRYAHLDESSKHLWQLVEEANGMSIFETIPKLLQNKGYVSWQGGKWWENSYRTADFDSGMTNGWNIDKFGTGDFFQERMGGEGKKLVRETMEPVFEFIDRNHDKPMFIWFGPSLPHTPFDAPYRFAKYYADKDLSESAKRYYANITWWDDGVSRLMDYMENKGLIEDTVFIYLSDNGWEQDADVEYWYPGVPYSTDSEWATGGLRGKGSLYDLGIRTPIIFYWKNKFERHLDDASLVSSLDVLPTILDIAGVPVPDDLPGYSLLPLLNGSGEIVERDEIVAYSDNRRSLDNVWGEKAEGYAVRTRQWHYFWYADTGEQRLYDVTVDPRGGRDLSRQRPDLIDGFKRTIAEWKDSIGVAGEVDIQ